MNIIDSNLTCTQIAPKTNKADHNQLKCTQTAPKTNYQCEYCLSYFSRSSTLRRHINNSCKVKKCRSDEKEDTYKIIQEMKNKINQLEKQINNNSSDINSHNNSNNNTINNITNITNNNINLVAFGNEDLSYITDEDAIKLLEKGSDSTILLIRDVHYNGDHPNHHNVYVSNTRSGNAIIYNGDAWVIKDKQEILDNVLSLLESIIYFLIFLIVI